MRRRAGSDPNSTNSSSPRLRRLRATALVMRGPNVGIDFLDAPLVPPALEWRVEPRLENLLCLVLGKEAGWERQNVCVVVPAGQLGNLRRPGDGGANMRISIRDVAHAEPRAAKQHPALGNAIGDSLGKRMRVVGVVCRLLAFGAEVVDVVAHLTQPSLELFLELEAGVVRRDQ